MSRWHFVIFPATKQLIYDLFWLLSWTYFDIRNFLFDSGRFLVFKFLLCYGDLFGHWGFSNQICQLHLLVWHPNAPSTLLLRGSLVLRSVEIIVQVRGSSLSKSGRHFYLHFLLGRVVVVALFYETYLTLWGLNWLYALLLFTKYREIVYFWAFVTLSERSFARSELSFVTLRLFVRYTQVVIVEFWIHFFREDILD